MPRKSIGSKAMDAAARKREQRARDMTAVMETPDEGWAGASLFAGAAIAALWRRTEEGSMAAARTPQRLEGVIITIAQPAPLVVAASSATYCGVVRSGCRAGHYW